jgi:integrase
MEQGEYIKELPVVVDRKGQDLTIRARVVKKDFAHYWDKDFVNQRIDAVANHEHKMFLRFLWMSGVRVSEAVGLRKMDIDFQNYTMTVRWLKSRKYNNRVVPLYPRLRDVLQVYVATLKAEDRVFPFTRQNAWMLTKKYLGGHPHQLRHSFAVNWLRCGGDIVVLHRVLGHSKIQTTMEYLKIVPVDQGKELIKISFD